jgi:TatD DNase family protein
MLHDAHNHLQDEWLAPHLDRIAGTARTLPIATMIVNGTCEADWPRVSLLARRFPFVRASYGLHPWDAGNRSPRWLELLRAQLAAEPGAAVGEIGLDRWMTEDARPDDPRLAGLRRASLAEQTGVFLAQLALATEENRPATIHCLKAFGALDEALQAHPTPARGFLLHAYGGPAELVPRFVKQGAYFSFNGYFLDPRHAKHREVFKRIPADRLLVETDAPAMPLPQPWRTHKLPPAPDGSPVNHPGNLDAAYAGLASLRGESLPALIAQVHENTGRLFGK